MSSNSENTSRQVSQSNLDEEITETSPIASTPQVAVSERSSFDVAVDARNNEGASSVEIDAPETVSPAHSVVSASNSIEAETNNAATSPVEADGQIDVLEALERGETRRRPTPFKFFKSPCAEGVDSQEKWLRIFFILGIFPLPILGWFIGFLYSICITKKTRTHRKLSGILGIGAAIFTILGGAAGLFGYDYFSKHGLNAIQPGHPKFQRATLKIEPSEFKDNTCDGFTVSSYIEPSDKKGEKTVLFILDNAPEGWEKEKLFFVPQRFNYKIAVANVKNIAAADKLYKKQKTYGNAVATAVLDCLKLNGAETTLVYGFNETDAKSFQNVNFQKLWDAVFAANTNGPCETIPGNAEYKKEAEKEANTWPTPAVSLEDPGKELRELKDLPKAFATHVGLANEFVVKTETMISVPVPAHVTYGSYDSRIVERKGSYESILSELFTLNKAGQKKLCQYKLNEKEHFTLFTKRAEVALASFIKYKEAMKGDIKPLHRAAIEEYL